MKTRVLTGTGILAGIVLAFWLRTLNIYLFDLFIGVVMIIGAGEVARVFERSGKTNHTTIISIYPIAVYLGLIFSLNAYHTFAGFLLVQLIIAAAFVVIAYATPFLLSEEDKATLLDKKGFKTIKDYSTKKTFNTFLLMLYPTFFLSFLFLLNHILSLNTALAINAFKGQYLGLIALVMAFTVTMVSDTFAYLVGSTFRGPKLAPKISPKKTISGAIGGIVGGILVSVWLYIIFSGDLISANNFIDTAFRTAGVTIWTFIAYGAVGSVFGQAGDLFASYVKRKAKAKDFGSIFPGHGGIMDRVDGLAFVAMYTFIYIIIFFL